MAVKMTRETQSLKKILDALIEDEKFRTDEELEYQFCRHGFLIWNRKLNQYAQVTILEDNDGIALEMDHFSKRDGYKNLVMASLNWNEEELAAEMVFKWLTQMEGQLFKVKDNFCSTTYMACRENGVLQRVRVTG